MECYICPKESIGYDYLYDIDIISKSSSSDIHKNIRVSSGDEYVDFKILIINYKSKTVSHLYSINQETLEVSSEAEFYNKYVESLSDCVKGYIGSITPDVKFGYLIKIFDYLDSDNKFFNRFRKVYLDFFTLKSHIYDIELAFGSEYIHSRNNYGSANT